MDALKGDWWI